MERCIIRILGRGWRSPQCLRNGVVERESKWYCKQHDPVEVERKRQERNRQGAERSERQREHNRRERAIARLCADIPTEVLESMIPLTQEA